jgi:site-specific DNA-methyltransferase (adenine-specific)
MEEKKTEANIGSVKNSMSRIENGVVTGKRSNQPKANHHPTVKPIKLMRWLCRLVTPPGGTVIDPFMGSGTTGIACKVEKFNFIGIEREKEYFEIAQARLKVNKNKTN